MTAVPAHDLVESRDCRVPGCDGDASSSPRYGRYANLCRKHHEEENRKRLRAGGASYPPPADGEAASGGTSLKAVAQKVVPAAADLERAVTQRRAATGRAREALSVFNAALQDLKDAAEALIKP